MSTNHPAKLDPALVRPGRVDVRVAFELTTTAQAEAYTRHFYGPAVAHEHVAAVGAALPSSLVSVAALQGALMQHPDAPERAAEAVAALAAAAQQEAVAVDDLAAK